MNMEQLQKENDELKFTLNCAKDINAALETENDELKAYIQRLRDEYEEAQGQWGGDYLWKKWDKDKILEETPPQSLNHIKAEVVEQCIEEVSIEDGKSLKAMLVQIQGTI